MIKLYKNETNLVPFTLFEKTTLVGAEYICQLYSNQNHDLTTFWLTGDTTNNNARYNYFPINETALNLLPGTYDYMVWQTTGATLTVSGLTVNDVVETGLCRVIGDTPTGSTFNNNKTEYTFN